MKVGRYLDKKEEVLVHSTYFITLLPYLFITSSVPLFWSSIFGKGRSHFWKGRSHFWKREISFPNMEATFPKMRSSFSKNEIFLFQKWDLPFPKMRSSFSKNEISLFQNEIFLFQKWNSKKVGRRKYYLVYLLRTPLAQQRPNTST